jgi:hypothetical protein
MMKINPNKGLNEMDMENYLFSPVRLNEKWQQNRLQSELMGF